MAVLARWVAESGQPTMTFATADASGLPHARTVLITEVDATSVRFHSSRPTTKTSDIAAQPRASGVFYWPGRQVVLRGVASELSAASSRAAFPSRPLGLRRLAWAYEALGADGSDSAVAPGDVRAGVRGRGRGAGDAAELDDDPARARPGRFLAGGRRRHPRREDPLHAGERAPGRRGPPSPSPGEVETRRVENGDPAG
jgi:hypothetical protein